VNPVSSGEYIVYVAPHSLFTRKLEVALQFYGAPFQSLRKRGSGIEEEIEARSGTHQMPVLRTPGNRMLADTTPLIEMLDARYPARRLFPEGPQGILAYLVEEFFDEWVARVMVHYRWNDRENARVVSEEMGNGDEAVTPYLRDWGPRACRATGTGTPELGRAADEEYRRLLSAMESQLQDTSYLLGEDPTAADCAVLGGLYAHILMDPGPRKMMRDFPTITAWADAQPGPAARRHSPERSIKLTPFARHALEVMAKSYCPFVLGNSDALRNGRKAFVIHTYGIEASYLTRPYPEESRAMLVRKMVDSLTPEELADMEIFLDDFGLSDAFSPAKWESLTHSSR
jgi:glutathione S-transferase